MILFPFYFIFSRFAWSMLLEVSTSEWRVQGEGHSLSRFHRARSPWQVPRAEPWAVGGKPSAVGIQGVDPVA